MAIKSELLELAEEEMAAAGVSGEEDEGDSDDEPEPEPTTITKVHFPSILSWDIPLRARHTHHGDFFCRYSSPPYPAVESQSGQWRGI